MKYAPNHPDPIVRRNTYRELFKTDSSNELTEAALTDDSFFVRMEGLKQGNVTAWQYARAFNDDDEKVKLMALPHHTPTQQQIKTLLSDRSYNVRNAAVEMCALTTEQLDAAYADPETRSAAIKTGKLSQQQINKAMSDDSWHTREAAADAGGKKSLGWAVKHIVYRIRCGLF